MGYGFMDSSSNPSYKGIFYVIGSKYKDLVLDKNLEPGFFTADCRERHRNVGDAHAAGAEPKAEPPRVSQYKSNDFYRAKFCKKNQQLPCDALAERLLRRVAQDPGWSENPQQTSVLTASGFRPPKLNSLTFLPFRNSVGEPVTPYDSSLAKSFSA
jgi:hypothetical protein